MYNIMHHNVVSSPLDHFAARVTLGPLVVVSVQLMAAVTSEGVQMPWECTLHHHSSVHVYLYLYVSILYDSIWFYMISILHVPILYDSIWFYMYIYIYMLPYCMILCDSKGYLYWNVSIFYDSMWFYMMSIFTWFHIIWF